MKISQRDWNTYIFKREVSQPLSAKVQQTRKIYTSLALAYNVSGLFRVDYKK